MGSVVELADDVNVSSGLGTPGVDEIVPFVGAGKYPVAEAT